MSPVRALDRLAIVVSESGRVLEVLLDELRGPAQLSPKGGFSEVVVRENEAKARAFLDALTRTDVAWPWELVVSTDGPGRLLQFAGSRAGDEYVVLATRSKDETRMLCRQLLRNEKLSASRRRALETLGRRLDDFDPSDSAAYEEVSRLAADLARTQRELARKNAELERMVQQKHELLGMAAHDLRNPLAGISGAARMLLRRRTPLPEVERSVIREIENTSKLLLNIVDGFLSQAAIESGRIRFEESTFHMESLLRDSISMVELAAERKGVRLRLETRDTGPMAGDRHKLQQVLSNLLSNAIKFSHSDSEVSIICARDGDHAVVTVRDRGVGLPPGMATLKPFETYPSTAGTSGERGHGFGSLIIRRIVEAHEGRITLRSEPGQGTEVSVHLPIRSPGGWGRASSDDDRGPTTKR